MQTRFQADPFARYSRSGAGALDVFGGVGEIEDEGLDAFSELEAEFRLASLPGAVLDLLRRGLASAAVRLATTFGHRDEDTLTNMVFFARHPERGGRKLTRGEPRFAQLRDEWLDIRDRLVRPALTKLPAAPPPSPPGAFMPIAVESPGGGRIRDMAAPRPADLVTVRGVGGRTIKLHRHAAQAWQAMVAAARADGIQPPLLLPTSGYRSPAKQRTLWEKALRKYGSAEAARKWVAPPGGSPHQTGRAIDFYLGTRNSSETAGAQRNLPAYLWLATNAKRFGFYPYPREPWHWEYNPPA